jgi:hypothetical protein
MGGAHVATPRRPSATDTGITRISVKGYKSIRTWHEIGIRPLTVLAGVNSSGKSSAIQPLLLLKQTLETPYDPGPLQLSGPNVDITAIEQVLSRPTGDVAHATSFRFGVTVGSYDTEWTFGKDSSDNLRVHEMTGWFFSHQETPVTLREGMTAPQLRKLFVDVFDGFGRQPDIRFVVVRERVFLVPEVHSAAAPASIAGGPWTYAHHELFRIIHLPALRGNPRRTYRTVAVEDRFPGTFEVYTAGVIAAWQKIERADLIAQLQADLQELGLTWRVEARRLDDTQVELMVGRLPQARQGGARDLVNIADVGFGVSQTLPVIVALLVAGPGQLVYLEQPEIHLHPRAQVAFASLLQRAVGRGVRLVVETHSALLIRAIQTLVAKQRLATEDVILHWFTRDHRTGDTSVSTAELDRAGAFGDWPEDFDEVHLESEARYLDAATEAGDAT